MSLYSNNIIHVHTFFFLKIQCNFVTYVILDVFKEERQQFLEHLDVERLLFLNLCLNSPIQMWLCMLVVVNEEMKCQKYFEISQR